MSKQIVEIVKRIEDADGSDHRIDEALLDLLRNESGNVAWSGELPTVGLTGAVAFVRRFLTPDHEIHLFSDCDSFFARVEFWDVPREGIYWAGFDGGGTDYDTWGLSLIHAALNAKITSGRVWRNQLKPE